MIRILVSMFLTENFSLKTIEDAALHPRIISGEIARILIVRVVIETIEANPADVVLLKKTVLFFQRFHDNGWTTVDINFSTRSVSMISRKYV